MAPAPTGQLLTDKDKSALSTILDTLMPTKALASLPFLLSI